MEVLTIEFKVSDKQLPTSGTKFETASFAVLISIPSDADDINPVNERTVEKRISIIPIKNLEPFIIVFDNFLSSVEADIPDEIPNIADKYNKGIIILSITTTDIFENMIYAERIATEVVVYPEPNKIETYIGNEIFIYSLILCMQFIPISAVVSNILHIITEHNTNAEKLTDLLIVSEVKIVSANESTAIIENITKNVLDKFFNTSFKL